MKTKQVTTIQLPVSNEHGIPIFADFLNEVQRRFEVEKDFKNAAFGFLVSKGLYLEFHKTLQSGAIDLMGSLDGRIAAASVFMKKEASHE